MRSRRKKHLAAVDCFLQVAELLAFPRLSCSDVLVLGLLQINPPIMLLSQELLGKLFNVVLIQIVLIFLLFSILQVFLAAQPNSGVILAHTGHSPSIQIKSIRVRCSGCHPTLILSKLCHGCLGDI